MGPKLFGPIFLCYDELVKEVSSVSERENPISVRSKRRITEALISLMGETSYQKITIKDLVERAGLTRQTFYHNFDSKDEVLLSRLDETVTGFIRFLSEKSVSTWEDVICCFFRYWQEQEDFLKLLMKNDLTWMLSEKIPLCFDSVSQIHFQQTDLTPAEAKYWYAFVSGALVNTLMTWLEQPGSLQARTLSQMVLSMLDGTMMARNERVGGFNTEEMITLLMKDTSKGRHGKE